jgi:hypothetical protein
VPQTLRNLGDAVTQIQQIRGNQVPDLVRAERANPGGDREPPVARPRPDRVRIR